MKKVTKIVMTGGPCGYKSGMLVYLTEQLTKMGVLVLTMPEAATLCITGGIHPMHEHVGVRTGQRAIIKTCRSLQQIWCEAAENIVSDQPVVVIMDRGVADSKAYTPEDIYHEILAELGTNHGSILHDADAVIHLVTAAEGAPQFYTTENNPARYETAEQAIRTDHNTRKCWIGTPHFSLIDNSGTLEDKKRKTLAVVLNAIGMPVPIEREKKFLVRLLVDEVPAHHVTFELQQLYCYSKPGTEVRVRMRTMREHGFSVCVHGQKMNVAGSSGRYELETYMPLAFWGSALGSMKDPDYDVIRKERTTFLINGKNGGVHYAELDKFLSLTLPGDTDGNLRLLEVEYTDEVPDIDLPPWMELVRDVTNDPRFKNRELARKRGSIEHQEELDLAHC